MNNIKDKLALMAPSLVFGEGEPLTVTVPLSGFMNPQISFKSTVFPLPLSPTMPYIPPSCSRILTSSRTVFPLKLFVSLSITITSVKIMSSFQNHSLHCAGAEKDKDYHRRVCQEHRRSRFGIGQLFCHAVCAEHSEAETFQLPAY